MMKLSDTEDLERLNAVYDELVSDAKTLTELQTGGLQFSLFIGVLLIFISALIIYENLELILFLQLFSFNLAWGHH